MPRKKELKINDLVREQLKGIKIDVDFINTLPDNERAIALADVERIYSNPMFKKIIEHLQTKQILFTTMEAENWEQVCFGRATINGLALFMEECQKLAQMYEEEKTKGSPKEFDPHALM